MRATTPSFSTYRTNPTERANAVHNATALESYGSKHNKFRDLLPMKLADKFVYVLIFWSAIAQITQADTMNELCPSPPKRSVAHQSILKVVYPMSTIKKHCGLSPT